MLNFIILGYIPGTTYQITFNIFLVAALVTLGMLMIKGFFGYLTIRKQARRIVAINLIAL